MYKKICLLGIIGFGAPAVSLADDDPHAHHHQAAPLENPYDVSFTNQSDAGCCGTPITVHLALKFKDSGKPVRPKDIDVVHTERIHLLITDTSLEDYQHIHPKPTKTQGVYAFQWTPKVSNPYKMWVNVTPKGAPSDLYIPVQLADFPPTSKQEHKETDSFKNERFDVALTFEDAVVAGKAVMGHVMLKDVKGMPIKDLEPVMGAFAHIVAFNQDLDEVAHLHPMGPEPTKKSDRGGPKLSFHLMAKKPGFYKFWVQIRHKGEDHYIPFGVRVKEG